MDHHLFLQRLRELPIEEGREYIRYHLAELTDHQTTGEAMAEEALRILYTPFPSLKLAELLIFYGEITGDLYSHALGLKAKGDALMKIGHHQAAIEALDAAGKEFLNLADEINWARSRISWIMSTAWLGRVEEALREGNRVREVFLRLGEPFGACAIDHNTGLIYVFLGRYQDALILYENMQAILLTLTDQDENIIKQRIALAKMNQAWNVAWLGNYELSHSLQQQALDGFIALEETDLIVNAEVNLADLDYAQGYYGSALRRYYLALDKFMNHQLDDPILLAELKLCIANCLVKLNRAQEACLLADEAVKLNQQFGILLSTGKALREYATTLAASGREKDALTALDDAWLYLKQGKFDSYAFATQLQRAELLLKLRYFDEAYSQAKLVKRHFEAQGVAAYVVQASLVIVDALIGKAQQAERGVNEQQGAFLPEALILCKQATSLARHYNLQEEAYKSHYLLGHIHLLMDNPARARRHYEAAIAQIERVLDDLLYDLSPAFLQSTWAVYEDLIALYLQSAQPERAFRYLEQARSIALRQYLNKSRNPLTGDAKENASATTIQQNNASILRAQYELRNAQEEYRSYNILLSDINSSASPAVDRTVLEEQLKRYEGKISELSERLYLYQHVAPASRKRRTSKANPLDIGQLQHAISPEQVLLAYFLYKGRLVIFAVTSERLVTFELADGLEQLELLLPSLHAHLDPNGWPDPQNPPEHVVRRLLNRLYNMLVKPVSELLSPAISHITIVPYGPLHKLPFHALYDGSHYLVERYQLNYLPASSLLLHFKSRQYERSAASAQRETVLKSPLILGYSDNGHLQRVHDEAEAIASLLQGRRYLDDDATIERLIEQAPNSPIIHLATHGQSRLDAPNFSYVRLADGQLNAIDAFGMDLKGCEMVTLSGCETGLALSGGGDEQLGLGRAFLAAGTTSLVMSLWPVEDNATNELMQSFYQNLLKGESKAQALRSAQCGLLRSASQSYTHPYFWAAFRLVGDVGPLKFTLRQHQ
jgi:CHAT domain-containing protein